MEEEKSKSTAPQDGSIEEKRVRPTVIRRRRKAAAAEPKAEPKVEEEVPKKEGAPEEVTAAEAAPEKVEKEEKGGEETSEAVKAVEGKPQEKGEVVEPKAVEEQVKVPPAVKPTPTATRSLKDKKGKKDLKPSTEVTEFPKARPEKKRTVHKKSVFGRDQLYAERGMRRKKFHPSTPGRKLKKTEVTVPRAAKQVVKIEDTITVAALSQQLGIKAADIIKKFMALDIMATVNQSIDVEAATLVVQELGYEVEHVAPQVDTLIAEGVEEEHPGDLVTRPPVVTVMGHVDHGKTSLLDAIRKTSVASGESGGITQHIGAYHVHLDKGNMTFLDTPGHEAFTSMRARGAEVTDIVILVVAANDGVMPQTVEAINHAKAAKVPIIVAINKSDLSDADPQRVKQELAQHDLAPEDWGGETICIEVSAKKGTHLKELLELVLLQAEMLELKANPSRPAKGVVVEAKLDKGRGPVATLLVHNGTVKTGDVVLSGVHYGRVRAMLDDLGKRTQEGGPSMPVEILGLSGTPEAGDVFSVVKDEATAKQVVNIRMEKAQASDAGKTAKVSLDDLFERIQGGEIKELGIIIKGDVQGSVEALDDHLVKLSTSEVKLKVMHSAVGGITEGDIMLASASEAIIIGFNIRPDPKIRALATQEGVDIRCYKVIYEVEDDIKKAMEGILAPIVEEKVLGRAEVRQIFKVSRIGTIAGSYVVDGKIVRTAKMRLLRDSVVIFDGRIAALRRFKDDAKEVASGFECGISLDGYNDVKVGDVLEAYILEERAAKL
ncbi:MAG: translation initiation factor IF-2 [Deltaproteobacteria bacterium]|nr:translation initiation factor IF-2 [Deltaproteobacteria bacterium]